MARSHGKILGSVWQDADWCALKPRDQWAYMLLVSQPKLSLVGCLDYMPNRWSAMAAGVTVAYFDEAVEALEDRDYVVTDHQTSELLVRTFVRHDGIANGNVNLRKGLWSAWTAVQSAVLRKVAVDNMPEGLFDELAPAEAQQMRRSEPMKRASERVLRQPSKRASEPTCILPSSSTCLLTPSVARPDDGSLTFEHVDLEHHEPARIPEDLRLANIDAVAALKAERHPRFELIQGQEQPASTADAVHGQAANGVA